MKEQLKNQLVGSAKFVISLTQLVGDVNSNIDNATYDDIKFMSNGFKELAEKTNLKQRKVKFNSYYYIKTNSLSYNNILSDDKPIFVPVPLDAVNKILNTDLSFKKRLLRYYCCLMSLLSGKKDSIGFVTLNTASHLSGYSVKSCIKYNKDLEKLQLIAFYDKHLATGSEHYMGNVFAEWSSRNLIPDYVQKYYPTYKQIEKLSVAERKSLKMKAHQVIDKGKTYDKDTMEQIKDYIEQSNRYNQEIIDDAFSTDTEIKKAQKRMFDLSAFELKKDWV